MASWNQTGVCDIGILSPCCRFSCLLVHLYVVLTVPTLTIYLVQLASVLDAIK